MRSNFHISPAGCGLQYHAYNQEQRWFSGNHIQQEDVRYHSKPGPDCGLHTQTAWQQTKHQCVCGECQAAAR